MDTQTDSMPVPAVLQHAILDNDRHTVKRGTDVFEWISQILHQNCSAHGQAIWRIRQRFPTPTFGTISGPFCLTIHPSIMYTLKMKGYYAPVVELVYTAG
jgi:hypothetical protein